MLLNIAFHPGRHAEVRYQLEAMAEKGTPHAEYASVVFASFASCCYITDREQILQILCIDPTAPAADETSGRALAVIITTEQVATAYIVGAEQGREDSYFNPEWTVKRFLPSDF